MKPTKKHPKPTKKVPTKKTVVEITPWPEFWATGFPEMRSSEPTTGCNVSLGAKPDTVTRAVRKEIERRTAILRRERAKYPPTLVAKGKGKKRKLVANPDFTPAMTEKLHAFAFTAEQVRAEVIS